MKRIARALALIAIAFSSPASAASYPDPTFASATFNALPAFASCDGLVRGNLASPATCLTLPLTAAYGGTGAGVLTVGSIPFITSSGVFSQDNANLFWDAANNRLGIGTATPLSPLSVTAAAGADPSLSSTTGLFGATVGTAQLQIGRQAASPFAYWLQTKKTTNDGSSFPLVINPLGGNVAVGASIPKGKLHVSTGDSGVASADASADDLVVESPGSGGMTVLTPSASTGKVYFGNTDGNARGGMYYAGSTDTLGFVTAGSARFTLTSSSAYLFGATGASYRLTDGSGADWRAGISSGVPWTGSVNNAAYCFRTNNTQVGCWSAAGLFTANNGITVAASNLTVSAGNATISGTLTASNQRGHVPDDTTLAATSVSLYPNGVWRDDYAAGRGAGPLFFTSSASSCATLGYANDGGSCRDAVGGSFVARPGARENVKQFGAVCDATGATGVGTDDSSKIQAAVTASQLSGFIIELPKGICRTITQLNITNRVTIEGVGAGNNNSDMPVAAGAIGVPSTNASWLFFDHTGVGLYVGSSSTVITAQEVRLERFGFLRKQPAFVTTGSWTPAAANYDLYIYSADVQTRDVVFWNATKAIFVGGGTSNRTRFSAQGELRISAYDIAMNLDRVNDNVDWNNLRIYPFDGGTPGLYPPVANYRKANLVGIRMARVDGVQASNTFIFGAYKGISFEAVNPKTSIQDIPSIIQFGRLYTDNNIYSIYADTFNQSMIQLTATFADASLNSGVSDTGTYGIYVKHNATNDTSVRLRFGKLDISNIDQNPVYFGGTGYIKIDDLVLKDYDLSSGGLAAFYLNSASAAVWIGNTTNLNTTSGVTFGGGPGYTFGASNFNVGRADMRTLSGTPVFATMGDATFTVNSQNGTVFVRDGVANFTYNVNFTTNAYTTPSGAFSISLNTPAPLITATPITLGQFSNVTLGASAYNSASMTSAGIALYASPSAGATASWSKTNIPASTTFTMNFTGSYRTY